MNKRKWMLTTLAVFLVTITSGMAANAQTRVFISSTGSDLNPCSRTSPCRNYQQAINTVLPGGEVIPLDSAGYGTISIVSKPISISVPSGIYAGVSVTAGTAVSISLAAGDVVNLSGIAINGNNTGTIGISVAGNSSGKVNITDCVVTRFASQGVLVTGGEVNIENTQITGNTEGVKAANQGPDQDPNTGGTTPRTTVVRISRGAVSDNPTAFHMDNAGATGTRMMGSCNAQNIFLRIEGGSNNPNTNIVGNTTFLSVTGTSDINAGCSGSVAMGTYSSQTQNGTTVANQ